jgi:hypothetical protein
MDAVLRRRGCSPLSSPVGLHIESASSGWVALLEWLEGQDVGDLVHCLLAFLRQEVASRPGISGRVDMNRLGKGLGKITNR